MQCFVCLEDDNTVRPTQCLCNMAVHDSCLLKCLQGKENVCSVCKTPYSNVGTRCTGCVVHHQFVLLFFGWLVVTSAATYMFILYTQNPDSQIFLATGVLFVGMIQLSFAIFCIGSRPVFDFRMEHYVMTGV